MRGSINIEELKKLGIQTKSLRQMYKNRELDWMMFGTIGEYIGDEQPQKIYEILQEKTQELTTIESEPLKRCLWVTAGPKIENFRKFYTLFREKNRDNQKLYILFKITKNPYSRRYDQKGIYYKTIDGMKYTDTAPRNKKTVKALVLRKFFLVDENFDYEQLEDMYYYFERSAYDTSTGKGRLNDIPQRLTVYPAILNTLILNRNKETDDIRNALGFCDYPDLLNELQARQAVLKLENNNTEQRLEFPKCTENKQAAYYILAEVEDYVQLQEEIAK